MNDKTIELIKLILDNKDLSNDNKTSIIIELVKPNIPFYYPNNQGITINPLGTAPYSPTTGNIIYRNDCNNANIIVHHLGIPYNPDNGEMICTSINQTNEPILITRQ